jgi:hypothetical protein
VELQQSGTVVLGGSWLTVAYTRIFSGGGGWSCQEFFSVEGSTNSVEGRGQRGRGSGGGSPLVKGSTRYANE